MSNNTICIVIKIPIDCRSLLIVCKPINIGLRAKLYNLFNSTRISTITMNKTKVIKAKITDLAYLPFKSKNKSLKRTFSLLIAFELHILYQYQWVTYKNK